MNFKDKLISVLLQEHGNPYDLSQGKKLDLVVKGSVRSTLSGKAKELWDKAQYEKKWKAGQKIFGKTKDFNPGSKGKSK